MNAEEINLEDVIKGIEVAAGVIKKALEDVNWFYRKSDGLLYFYKHKPSVVRENLPFNPVIYKVTPIKGDREQLLPEKNNSLNFIPKNTLIHRDDLEGYKNKD